MCTTTQLVTMKGFFAITLPFNPLLILKLNIKPKWLPNRWLKYSANLFGTKNTLFVMRFTNQIGVECTVLLTSEGM